MNTMFKIKEEAEEEVLRLTELGPTRFCPLIRGTCRGNCICIITPTIRSTTPINKEEVQWHVYGWSCENAMFWGAEV